MRMALAGDGKAAGASERATAGVENDRNCDYEGDGNENVTREGRRGKSRKQSARNAGRAMYRVGRAQWVERKKVRQTRNTHHHDAFGTKSPFSSRSTDSLMRRSSLADSWSLHSCIQVLPLARARSLRCLLRAYMNRFRTTPCAFCLCLFLRLCLVIFHDGVFADGCWGVAAHLLERWLKER